MTRGRLGSTALLGSVILTLHNMTNDELKKWLRDNSSGVYQPAREAAERIEMLEAALRACVLEMRYSRESGQPISPDRREFAMAKRALSSA